MNIQSNIKNNVKKNIFANNSSNSQQIFKPRIKTETKCFNSCFLQNTIIQSSSLIKTIKDIAQKKELKRRLKEYWHDFIMEYPIYKHTLCINLNTNEEEKTKEEALEIDFGKLNFKYKFELFLLKNDLEKLMIDKYSLKSLSNKGSLILTYVEPWVIFIKIIIEDYLTSLTPKEFGELFTIALNHCEYSLFTDEIKFSHPVQIVNILFMFYCIYISEIEKKLFESSKDSISNWKSDCKKYMPIEFMKLWKENTKEITECLIEENYKKILTLSTENRKYDIIITPKPKLRLTNNQIFSAFQPMRDMYHSRIVEDDFQQSGDFAVLELTQEAQKRTGERFIFTPLKINHDSIKVYSQVEEMIKKYPDYLCQPYKDEIALNIKGNERLSFDTKNKC